MKLAHRNSPFAHLLTTFLLSLTLAACGQGGPDRNHEANADEEDEAPPIPVETRTVGVGPVYASYSGTAALETDAESQVVAKVIGEVVEILVEEGETVTAGQVLARLDGEKAQLELARAEANLRRLRQEMERNQRLRADNLISVEAYERSLFDFEAQLAARDLAELDLSYTEITAPIDGVIAERMIRLGNTLTTNQVTFKISALDPLLAYMHVPERHFNRLMPGQPALIHADALPESTFEGVIARISPVVDPATGTFKVTVEVRDESRRLKPGMFTRVNIVYDSREAAVLVPRSALMEDEDEDALFIVNDEGVAQRVVVETGYRSAGDVEIVAGLEGGEDLVIIGQAGLRDQASVIVVSRDGVVIPRPDPEPEDESDAEEETADDD
jgi:membrane fusion protein (multidrug efflux system)